MDWNAPFIIYRITPEGKLVEVYHATDLKSAKYWLNFIAETGDVLCKTPAHPNYKEQTGRPEYWSHKHECGESATNKAAWEAIAKEKKCEPAFPCEQLTAAAKS